MCMSPLYSFGLCRHVGRKDSDETLIYRLVHLQYGHRPSIDSVLNGLLTAIPSSSNSTPEYQSWNIR